MEYSSGGSGAAGKVGRPKRREAKGALASLRRPYASSDLMSQTTRASALMRRSRGHLALAQAWLLQIQHDGQNTWCAAPGSIVFQPLAQKYFPFRRQNYDKTNQPRLDMRDVMAIRHQREAG